MNFRREMLASGSHPDCSDCHSVEDAGGTSLRQQLNSRHPDTFEAILRHAESQGDATPLLRPGLPVSLDLRLSNVCNFRCRSCGPENSTSWYEDAKRNETDTTPKATRLLPPGDPEASDRLGLPALLKRVTYIYFAGGEPLIDPLHADILRQLLELGRSDVILDYNTNLSLSGPGGTAAPQMWKHFSRVFVSASLDGVGEAGALIRKGFDWKSFTENYRWLRSEIPHLELRLYWTLSSLNAHHLPEAVHDILGLGDGHSPVQFAVNIANAPDEMNLSVFTDAERAELRLRYLNASALLLQEPRASHTLSAPLIRELMRVARTLPSVRHSPEARQQFIRRTKSLDLIRGESTARILPDLGPILGA